MTAPLTNGSGSKPDYPCPACGGTVRWDFTCHTYGWKDDGTGGMACLYCDSAVEYECLECDWSYVDGLNPRNPRSAANVARRPAWLVTPDGGPLGLVGGMPGVPSRWDDDDD